MNKKVLLLGALVFMFFILLVIPVTLQANEPAWTPGWKMTGGGSYFWCFCPMLYSPDCGCKY